MSPSSPDPTPRQRLIQIAMGLLDHHHPEDLSLREVARRAGLTSGAPAHHFGNKLGLLAACAEVAWAEMCTHLEAADPGASPEEALQNKARAYVGCALASPGPYRLMTSRLFKHGDATDGIAAWRDRAMGGVVALVAQALGERAEPMLAKRRGLAVWALLHGHITLVLEGSIFGAKVDILTDDVCQLVAVIATAPEGGGSAG